MIISNKIFKDVNTEFIKHFVENILCYTETFEEYKLAITEFFEISDTIYVLTVVNVVFYLKPQNFWAE